MLIKIFGALDIIAALAFVLNNNFDRTNSWFPNSLILIIGIYLLLKGLMFLLALDWISLGDVICAILILFSLHSPIHPLLAFLMAIFLLQKGILSLAQ